MKLPKLPSSSAVLVTAVVLWFSICPGFGADADGDGMSDVWQRIHNIPTATGTNDLDGDRGSNFVESKFGTNPRVPDTRGLPSFVLSNGYPAAFWSTVIGVRYQLERSTNLVTWHVVGPIVEGDGTIRGVADFSSPVSLLPAMFFRLAIIESLDRDIDGLSAFEEALFGTSEMNADADADGFTDLDEFMLELDPTKDDFASGVVTHIYTYDPAGRLLSVKSVLNETFSYDEEGNLTLLK